MIISDSRKALKKVLKESRSRIKDNTSSCFLWALITEDVMAKIISRSSFNRIRLRTRSIVYIWLFGIISEKVEEDLRRYLFESGKVPEEIHLEKNTQNICLHFSHEVCSRSGHICLLKMYKTVHVSFKLL